MKLYKMIEIYLKYDNMHTIRTINAFICINNHVNSCINSMLSKGNHDIHEEYMDSVTCSFLDPIYDQVTIGGVGYPNWLIVGYIGI